MISWKRTSALLGVSLFVLLVAAGYPFWANAGNAMADTPTGSWLVEDIRGGGVIDNLQTTLEIAADGSVSGNAGCNRYFGKAEIGKVSITFGPLGSTKMACAPAVMDQEQKFHDALTEVAGWRLEPTGHLVLTDADGEPLVRLIGS